MVPVDEFNVKKERVNIVPVKSLHTPNSRCFKLYLFMLYIAPASRLCIEIQPRNKVIKSQSDDSDSRVS